MEELLKLFESLIRHLDKLTDLAKQKTITVRKNDLMDLDRILREEQAIALALRGIDQKRTVLLQKLDLMDVPLIDLPAKAPDTLQQDVRKTVENLRHAYQIYASAAEVARNTLECNLHEIEHFLAAAGVDSSEDRNVEPPSQMKADFRA